MPKISVVMPAYNAEQYIAEAIDSILAQTFRDFEFLIIDDGSTDRTAEIIRSYDDPRIRCLKNERNSGIVVSLNRGLAEAVGEYIARMDSDDISLPERFEKQVQYLDAHPETGALGAAIRIFGEGIPERVFPYSVTPEMARADLLFNSPLAHPVVMMRARVLRERGLQYERDYQGLEDFVLWWRIAQSADIVSLPDVLLCYRKHISQITKNQKPEFYAQFFAFVQERLSVFACPVSEEESRVYYKYCVGQSAELDDTALQTFLALLKKLLQQNLELALFDQEAMQAECSAAFCSAVRASGVSGAQRRRQFRLAYRAGLLDTAGYLKAVIRSFR